MTMVKGGSKNCPNLRDVIYWRPLSGFRWLKTNLLASQLATAMMTRSRLSLKISPSILLIVGLIDFRIAANTFCKKMMSHMFCSTRLYMSIVVWDWCLTLTSEVLKLGVTTFCGSPNIWKGSLIIELKDNLTSPIDSYFNFKDSKIF